MADLPPSLKKGDDTDVRPKRSSASGTPRWVKVFGIIILVVILLFAISLLAGVQHGPGLHTPSGEAGGHTLLSSGDQNISPGVQQP